MRGAQFVDIDRLGEIIDAAGFERVDDMFGLGQSGHEDHRHLRYGRIGLQRPAGLKTVHAGHDGIHQDHVRRDAIDDIDGGVARGGDQHGEAGLLQSVGEKAQRFRGIVHDEHDVARMHCFIHQSVSPVC